MTTPATGAWIQESVAGHAIDLFEPLRPGEHGCVVLYLHGVNLTRLNGNQVFTSHFSRHGLRVAAPMTGRSWWTNRICEDFDPVLTAERHLLDEVLPFIERRW